jgi:hypothetical protein
MTRTLAGCAAVGGFSHSYIIVARSSHNSQSEAEGLQQLAPHGRTGGGYYVLAS